MFFSGLIRNLSISLGPCSELAPLFWFGTCFCISSSWRQKVYTPSKLLLPKLTHPLGLSQREWLSDAVNLLARLDTIFQVLDSAVDQLNDQGTLLSVETHEERQTYLLVSSCKLFGITAQARIYMETSKLPILPKSQVIKFRTLAMDSIQSFLTIHETFNQEGDLRYLDYFVIVSRGSFSTVRSLMSLTVATVVLGSHSQPLPGTLPRRTRFLPAYGDLSANYPVGGSVKSYSRRQGCVCSAFHGGSG